MRAAVVVVGGMGIIIAVAVRRALVLSPPMHWSSTMAALSAGVARLLPLLSVVASAKLRVRLRRFSNALMPG